MDEADGRKVTVEHAVNFEEIRSAGLDVSYELEYAGWTNFFSIRENVYSHTLKEFWKSSRTTRHSFLYSVVGNVNTVRHQFDVNNLEKATGCAREGIGYSGDWEESENKEDVNLTLFGNSFMESKSVLTFDSHSMRHPQKRLGRCHFKTR